MPANNGNSRKTKCVNISIDRSGADLIDFCNILCCALSFEQLKKHAKYQKLFHSSSPFVTSTSHYRLFGFYYSKKNRLVKHMFEKPKIFILINQFATLLFNCHAFCEIAWSIWID